MATVSKINVNDLTFGIEIETTIPAGACEVGGHGMGRPVPQLGGRWLADADPSIRVTIPGHVKCEFVSPVFKGEEGLKQLLADLAVIRSMGAAVNASCGLHIHVGFNKRDSRACEKLASTVSNLEKAIFASTGTKNRELGRNPSCVCWCKGMQQHGTPERALQHATRDRYHVVNFSTCKPTVEFRAFGASLNAVKIVGYIRMCLGLVEKSLSQNKKAKWVPKQPVATSPYHREGVGQTAITRLFYFLGWTKGDESHAFGNVTTEGAPGIDEVKKEFVRLAKKYDAEA